MQRACLVAFVRVSLCGIALCRLVRAPLEPLETDLTCTPDAPHHLAGSTHCRRNHIPKRAPPGFFTREDSNFHSWVNGLHALECTLFPLTSREQPPCHCAPQSCRRAHKAYHQRSAKRHASTCYANTCEYAPAHSTNTLTFTPRHAHN